MRGHFLPKIHDIICRLTQNQCLLVGSGSHNYKSPSINSFLNFLHLYS